MPLLPADAPQISILVPVYNVQAYLPKCLDSILSQGFTDFEAILLNDGSTDGSAAICHRYASRDARLSVVDKPNSGYGATLNLGLGQARGAYIAILESDDFYAPDALGALHQAAETHGAEVAKANCYKHWSRPLPFSLPHVLVPPGQSGRPVDPHVDREIFALSPSVWSGLYRRDFLLGRKIGFLETPGASYQDVSFSFKVWASATRVAFVPMPLVYYRQDNESSSVNSPGKAYCVVDEFAEVERYLDEASAPEWLYAVMAKLMFEAYLWNYERLGDGLQLEFLRFMAESMAGQAQLGRLEMSSLEGWQRADLEAVWRSPDDYHASRCRAGQHSAWGRLRHYLAMGGVGMLYGFIRSKVFHR
jgi:glycosyltransferase involved in cell wall biosynthesis